MIGMTVAQAAASPSRERAREKVTDASRVTLGFASLPLTPTLSPQGRGSERGVRRR